MGKIPDKIKKCIGCGDVKPLEDFKKRIDSTDGRRNKCKACINLYESVRYRENIEYYTEYYRKKQRKPERKKYNREWMKKYRIKKPERFMAYDKTHSAIREGRLIKEPCSECGSIEVQAHHESYLNPLDVVWLCHRHHALLHRFKNDPNIPNSWGSV